MYFCRNLLEKIVMEESRLLFEISEDIVAKENVSADDLQDYLENPYHVKGTIFVVCMYRSYIKLWKIYCS